MVDHRNWRINSQIRANEVRVIGSDGKQIGILEISKARELADKESLDLIEIAPQAVPPVVKIANFGKFLYLEEKKERAEKRKIKGGEVKEIRFSPFIAEADFDTRIKRVREFLDDKNKVRIVVKFKGRQMDVKNSGYEVTNKVLEKLGETVSVDMKPKFLGRHLVMVISPKRNIKKVEGEKNAKNEN